MVLIYESYPAQYRAPVYQELEKLCRGRFLVVYASDFSVRGYLDREFGKEFAWDVPLLEGYQNIVLQNENAGVFESRELSGKGVDKLIVKHRPKAIVLPHAFNSTFAMAAYLGALRRAIPIWIRMEVQDDANSRGIIKTALRSMIYRVLYAGVKRFFYIGVANRKHYLKHGVNPSKMRAVHYCVRDSLAAIGNEEKFRRRNRKRQELGFTGEQLVIAFFGKLIPKKDPAVLLRSLTQMSASIRKQTRILYVGAGELEPELRVQAKDVTGPGGESVVVFAGFVNQSALPDYYLAADIVVLPSRRKGETWGLVINEALHAGCAIVVTDAVGCSQDFGTWERVRVISVGDESALAKAVGELATYSRDFSWATANMTDYTVEAAAKALAEEIRNIESHGRENYQE